MDFFEILSVFAIYIIGTLLSLIITGFLVNKLVIKKVMANPDIQDLIKLFREGKELLKKILENQKHDG
jgi:hypothetical protein